MIGVLPAFASTWDGSFPSAPSCEAVSVEIALVGDVMQHGQQLRASLQPDGSTSWRGVFDAIAPLIRDADLALANLETPVDEGQAYDGYPRFNAPETLLVALRDAGFDVLQTANNHCLDRGREGALATLEAVHRHGFGSAGTYASAEDRASPWVIRELPGPITVAFLAYTYGTNGQPMPEGEPWLVNWLDEGVMQADVARASDLADLVVVGLHWGAEYQHRPAPWQTALARSLVDAGADVIMGHHPHVLQPAELLSVERPEGRRDALVLYSLGNFVSNQRPFPRDGGVIARVTASRCPSGEVHLTDARFTPVWVDDRRADERSAFRVLPVRPAGMECPGFDLDEADCKRMDAFRTHAGELLPATRFDWQAGSTARTASCPVWFPLARSPSCPTRPSPSSVWPPDPFAPSQADGGPR